MNECSIPGCVDPRKSRGWCQKHYTRWWKHGDPLAVRELFERRSPSLSVLVNGKPCREYQGKLNPAGYARVTINGKAVMLHRWVVEQIEGPLLPFPDEIVMHDCDNPPCFLYEHLRRATCLENMRDAEAKGRVPHPRGVLHPNCKLTDEQVAEIRLLRSSNLVPHRQLAASFGVSRTLIRKILSNEHRP